MNEQDYEIEVAEGMVETGFTDTKRPGAGAIALGVGVAALAVTGIAFLVKKIRKKRKEAAVEASFEALDSEDDEYDS